MWILKNYGNYRDSDETDFSYFDCMRTSKNSRINYSINQS